MSEQGETPSVASGEQQIPKSGSFMEKSRNAWERIKQGYFHGSERDKRRDAESSERHRDNVLVAGLTPEELEKRNIPTSELQHLEIGLTSQADRKYKLWYNYHDSWEHSPKVAVHAPEGDKDPEDFAKVKATIAELNNGSVTEEANMPKIVTDKNADIRLRKTYSMQEIADLMRKYSGSFKDVGGADLSFRIARERSLKFAEEIGIPREQVKISSWDYEDTNVTEKSKDPNKSETFRFLEDSHLVGLAEVPAWIAATGGALALGQPEAAVILAGAASWSFFFPGVTGQPIVAAERAIRFGARKIKELRGRNKPPENGNNMSNTPGKKAA